MSEMNSNRVQLGCGSLIIIALIVMIFSGRSNVEGLRRDVQDLTRQVQALRQEVHAMPRCR